MAERTPCFRRCSTISVASPNQEGVERTDWEDVWMITDPSAILFIWASLMKDVVVFPSQRGTFLSLFATRYISLRIPWEERGWEPILAGGRVVARSCGRCAVCPNQGEPRRACLESMIGRFVGEASTALCSWISRRTRPLICCPIELLRREPRGWWLILACNSSAETAQVNMRGEPSKVLPKPFRSLIASTSPRILSEVVERILSHHRQALRQIRFVPTSPGSSSPLAVRYLRPDRKLRKQEVLQARQERAESVQRLLAQGMTQLAIARHLHLNRKTVALYAKAQSVTPVSQPARAGILAPFTRYLLNRRQAGERNGVGLSRDIVARGYTGSRMTVERFLLGLR